MKLTSPLIRRGVFAPLILGVEFGLIVFAPVARLATARTAAGGRLGAAARLVAPTLVAA